MPAENGVSYSGRISPFELSSAEKHLSLSFVSKASNHPFLEQSILLITSYHSCPRAQLRTNYLGLSSSEHSDNLAPYLKSERRNFGAAADVKRMKKEDEICARCTVKGRVFSFYQHPIRRELFIITSTFSSVQSLSRVRLFATPWIAAPQASLSITNFRSSPNPCPLSQWWHPAISSSVVPFSSCPQSLPASGSFLMSQLFAWGGQSIGVLASTSILPKNTQGWSPLEWSGWISLQSWQN